MGCTLRALSSPMSSSVPSAGNLSIPLSVHKGRTWVMSWRCHPSHSTSSSYPWDFPSNLLCFSAQVFESCCCIPQHLLCQCHEPQAVLWQLSSPLPTYIIVTLLKKKFCHQHSNLLENKNTWKSPATCARCRWDC